MRKGDIIWGGILLLVMGYILSPYTNHLFLSQTSQYPYVSGFVKFAVLSTMGELLTMRIRKGSWKKPPGFIWRIVIWGLIGMLITLIFQLFASGVKTCLDMGYLPGRESHLAFAFFTSLLMNTFFAPVFMSMHMISDAYLDIRFGLSTKPTYQDVLKKVKWQRFADFVVLKTIPFFWIPAHTVTFLMPKEYRIVMAALLSIALGGILAFAGGKRS